MTAPISIEMFRKRLVQNTKRGNPVISGTPFHVLNLFGEKDKKFFGKLSPNEFQITANAVLHPIPYILKGQIKPVNAQQTEIVYEITPIKFGYYWIRYFPMVMLVVCNGLLITDNAPVFALVIFNVFIIIAGMISNLMMNHKRKQFEITFKILFEIID